VIVVHLITGVVLVPRRSPADPAVPVPPVELDVVY